MEEEIYERFKSGPSGQEPKSMSFLQKALSAKEWRLVFPA
jgi:hypothetical protein